MRVFGATLYFGLQHCWWVSTVLVTRMIGIVIANALIGIMRVLVCRVDDGRCRIWVIVVGNTEGYRDEMMELGGGVRRLGVPSR